MLVLVTRILSLVPRFARELTNSVTQSEKRRSFNLGCRTNRFDPQPGTRGTCRPSLGCRKSRTCFVWVDCGPSWSLGRRCDESVLALESAGSEFVDCESGL